MQEGEGGRKGECLQQRTVRNETFAWTSLRPNGSSSPSFPLSVSRHKSFTAPLLLPSSASSGVPLSLVSFFANRSDREATQSYIFPAGAPSVLPLPSSLPSVGPSASEGGREGGPHVFGVKWGGEVIAVAAQQREGGRIASGARNKLETSLQTRGEDTAPYFFRSFLTIRHEKSHTCKDLEH